MSLFSKIRDTVTGTIAPLVGGGMVANTIIGGITGATGLAGLLGGGALPPPGGQYGGQGQYGSQQDFGPQQNIAGLMNMIGQQQPSVTGGTIGGGGLI